MAEISPVNNDLNIFKEEILNIIKESEKKLTEQIKNKDLKSNVDFENFSNKINSLIEKNKEVVNDLITQKMKVEKIAEFETFKNKVDGMLITHEIRIKNTVDEIEKIKTKYDKIVSENLYVSGFIGNSCQFRNLSEYLSYNISEVSKIKLEREQFKKDIKELKNKMDALMKNVITMNDNSVKLCNKYTDHKQEEFFKLLQSTTKELNQKSMDMRTMVLQFQADSDKNMNNLKLEFDKLLNMKDELNDYINEKYRTFEIKFDELNLKTINNSENIEKNQYKLGNLKEDNSNLDKRIKELSFLIRNCYLVSNKLAELLERLGANPSNSEISKLIFGSLQAVGVSPELNKNLSVSPQPRRKTNNKLNVDLLKFSLDDMQSFKNNNTNTINNASKDGFYTSDSPQRKSINNIIELKRFKVNDDNKNNLDSDNSSIEDDPINKNQINNVKQTFKNNNINNITNSNKNINNKNNTNKNINNIDNTNKNTNNINNINKNINGTIKIKDNNIIKEIISNTQRGISSPKQFMKHAIKNNKIQKLPLLSLVNKEENTLEELKYINLSSTMLERNHSDNNKFNNYNNNFIRIQRNKMKKIDKQMAQDTKACRIVTLSLNKEDETTVIRPVINMVKNRKENDKKKFQPVNSLINDYRAKLFTKATSYSTKTDTNNDILDIPKKVTQAFGRTTHAFYFKKDAINKAYANKNINNFGYNGPKPTYKFKSYKKIDTEKQ